MAASINNTNVSSFTEFYETKISYYIGLHGMFIVATIGIITNTLSFMVFGRFNPQTGTTLYLQALAMADLISLAWDTVISTALPLLGIPVESASNWACKIFIWHDMSSSTVASCALLVVAMDRFVSLNFSNFHKRFCTRRTALCVSIGLWIFTYLYCSPLIYFYEMLQSDSCNLSFDPYKSSAGLKFVTFVTYGPYFSIPVVGIIVSNVSIVKMLCMRKKNRGKMGKDEKAADDISWLLVIDCVAFLVLIGVVATLWALSWSPPANDHERVVFQLMFVLAQFISCIEESIGFFLYLICSRAFRRTFFGMFGFKMGAVESSMALSDQSAFVKSRQSRTLDA